MALYIPHSIFHLAWLLYVRPGTFGPNYVLRGFPLQQCLHESTCMLRYTYIVCLVFVASLSRSFIFKLLYCHNINY